MAKLKSIKFFDGFESETTPVTSLPSLGDVFPVADIAARDALPLGTGDDEVQEGDVAIVTDASADPDVGSGGATYIYDGSDWERLLTPTDVVQSVNGETGVVVLDTDGISEGSNLYFTDARAEAAVADELAGKQDINTDPFTFEIKGELDNPIFESYNSNRYVESARTFTSAIITTENQIGDFTVEVRSYDNAGSNEVIHVSESLSITALGFNTTSATLDVPSISADRYLKLYLKVVPNASTVIPIDGSLSVSIK